ncbi:MAG: ABC transporter ATP-binding protein [Pseudomonadota bacterium]
MVIMSESPTYLRASDLSVRFPAPSHIVAKKSEIGGQILQRGSKRELLAVDNVSFELAAGDALGLLGHNGSGKTTLLKTLAGIYTPSGGAIEYAGLLGNALNTNIGFRPERSGRYNIKLKSILAGRRSKDLPNLIEDVESFSELGPFLDMPMHTYSAGMRARLAFGLATAFRYDILLLDEWLGAGDQRMRDKAAQRMSEFVAASSITVLASHSASLLKRVCNLGMVLLHGRSVFLGPVDEALELHEELQARK